MFYLIDNTLTNSFGADANASISLNSQLNGLGISNAAHRLTQIGSGNFAAVNTYNNDISSKGITLGVTLKPISNVDSFDLVIVDAAGAVANSQVFSIDISNKEFNRYIAEFNTNSLGTPVQFQVRVASRDLTTSDQIDFAGFYAQIGSDNNLPVFPEYDYKEEDRKFEERHRVRSGKEYVYKWSDYKILKFSVMYVDSNFKSICNSWFKNNTDLLWIESGTLEVASMHINNKSLPINGTIKPYTDTFMGKIDLGTY